MAPKRQFSLSRSLRPHTERPYSPVSSVASVEHVEHVEQAKDNWSPELDLHIQDEDHTDHSSGDSWKEDASKGDASLYEGIYGWYVIQNDEEADIERYLRAPKAIPMVWKTESWRITRAEGLVKFQPIAEKFKASCATANVTTQVRNIFTKDTIRVLPPHEKRLLKMNAELHGAADICEWLQNEKEDLQETYWEEKHQVAHLSEKSVEEVWADLYHLSEHSTLYLASRFDPRITALKTLFDAQKQRIEKLEKQLRIKNPAVQAPNNSVEPGMTKKSFVRAVFKRAFCRGG